MLRTWLQGLARATPSRCGVCGRWPAQPVCTSCIQRFAAPRLRCRRCALPVPPTADECGACMRNPPPLARSYAAVDYRFPWSGLVGQFKFSADPAWSEVLAALMRSAEGVAQAIEEAQVLVPMPLSGQRLQQRGFNQALELSRRLCSDRTDAGLLLRLRDTAPQPSLGREARQANVRGAFGVEPLRHGELRGARVLLVDDVMTSGASLFAAAEVLKSAGAAEVSAVVLARTDAMTE